ncbi:MAG: dienelactone hydrolase family protein [Alphaproteobacteria bacterium]
MTETLAIPMSGGAAMGAEIASPKSGPAPGILIIPAIFGIDDGVCEIMDHWAARGCVALAVDSFHRSIPGTMGRDEAGREKAQKRYAAFDAEQGMKDFAEAIAWLRKDTRCNGKVVVFGYCFGGRYAFLAAARGYADGAVSFHGTKIGLNLDEAKNVCRPLSIHVGDKDASIPMSEVEATRKALEGNPLAEVHVYPGCVHGFTGKGRPSFDAAADAASTAAAERLIRSITPFATVPA